MGGLALWVYCCVCLRRKGTGGLGRALALDNLVNLEFVVVETASSEPQKVQSLGFRVEGFRFQAHPSFYRYFIYIYTWTCDPLGRLQGVGFRLRQSPDS